MICLIKISKKKILTLNVYSEKYLTAYIIQQIINLSAKVAFSDYVNYDYNIFESKHFIQHTYKNMTTQWLTDITLHNTEPQLNFLGSLLCDYSIRPWILLKEVTVNFPYYYLFIYLLSITKPKMDLIMGGLNAVRHSLQVE